MNDRLNSDPILDSTSLNAPSRRLSGSSQGSSTARRSQDGSSRSSGHQSTYEDLAKSLKQQLLVANRQLKELRAADNERQISTVVNQLKLVNDARVAAVQEAAKANEELRLYKIQLQNAHQEIRRAQQIIDKVEQERYDAEKAASEARTVARRCQRDLLLMKAMEEGRKLGMQEGIEEGRALALREAGQYEDMNDEDYADEYLDYAYPEVRPRSLLASNEEIVIGPPQPLNRESPPSPPQPIESPPPPPPQPIPVPPPASLSQPPIPVPPPVSAQLLPQPTPVPAPESVQPPRPFRTPSPSVIHRPISIPPDGYIPTIDSDNVIRMPPPHELGRPPPTPERPASPQLPVEAMYEEPRPSSRSHRRHQSNSSFVSASTFSNAVGPSGRAQPLSAIPEVHSPYTTPIPQPTDGHMLRHQPSQTGSYHSNIVNPERGGTGSPLPVQVNSNHRRPSVSSNSSRPLRPPSLSQEDRRKSGTSSSVPGINIIPPSRSLSSATLQSRLNDPASRGEGITDFSRSPMVSQLFGDRTIGQPGPSSVGTAQSSPHRTPEALPIPMPGAYQDSTDQASTREPHRRPGSSSGHRFDDDVMSVRSGDTLTTARRRSHHQHRTSSGSLTTPPFENYNTTGWEDAVRLSSSSVPVPHDNQTSRPVSRSTNRSNR